MLWQKGLLFFLSLRLCECEFAMFTWPIVERLVIFVLLRERGYSVCYTSHFCLVVCDYSKIPRVYQLQYY